MLDGEKLPWFNDITAVILGLSAMRNCIGTVG